MRRQDPSFEDPTSPTRAWHNDTYPAINPTRPELTAAIRGKKVVISGAGTGIGRATALAFAGAGAISIFILGRRAGLLEETKQLIHSKHGNKVIVETLPVDVTDLAAVKKAASTIGNWNVLVSNAGVLTHGSLTDVDAEAWWKGFEVNIRGPFNLLHSLLPTRSSHSIIISMNAATVQMPTIQADNSSYNASKIAALRLIEIASVEYPDVHFVNLHPGMVATDMMPDGAFGLDTVELPAHFALWLCSEEARHLGGRLLWCNWDVEELVGWKGRMEQGGEGGVGVLKTTIAGFPFENQAFGGLMD